MINATEPQAVYTKTPPTGELAGVPQAPSTTSTMAAGGSSKRNPRKTFFGIEMKALGAVAGLVTFLLLIFAGAIFVYRFQNAETLAPSQPKAGSCALTFTVGSPETDFECTKLAYRDEFGNADYLAQNNSYQYLTQQTSFQPGQIVVFRVQAQNTGDGSVTLSLSDPLTDAGLNYATFIDSTCGASAYNSTTNTLTCDLGSIAVGASKEIGFRMQIPQASATLPTNFTMTNTATITDGTTPVSCSVEVSVTTPGTTPTPTPTATPSTYTCNSDCTTDAQCQTANAAYVCSAADGNKCRLDTNRTSATCTPPTNTYTCNSACTSNEQCVTIGSDFTCYQNFCRRVSNPTAANCALLVIPTPSPVPGCNEVCATNGDCSNPNHICVTTADGTNRCRLDNYPNSTTCSVPPIQTVVTQTKGGSLPQELPVAGGLGDTLKTVVAGVGAVVIGALAILLLL